MELPVENRNRAIANTLIIFFLVIIFFPVLYSVTPHIGIIYTGIILIVSDMLIGFFYIRMHDIKSVICHNGSLEIYHRSKLIKIPLKEITDITWGLNYYIDIKGRLSYTYILHFNTKYVFGRKLFLKFYFKDKVKVEPYEIQILRKNMNDSKHETK